MEKKSKKMQVCILVLAVSVFSTPVSGKMFEGIVEPNHEVAIAFPLDGVIEEIFVKEGDSVKKNVQLIKLDDSLQALETKRKKQIYEDYSELETYSKNLSILNTLYGQTEALYQDTGSVSFEELKKLEMQVHNMAGKILMIKARKVQEKIDYEISQEVLSRYILKSPIDGIITEITPELGEWAKIGEMVVTVTCTTTCFVEFNIDESYARNISKGQDVLVNVREGEHTAQKTGKVVFVSTVADRASALVRVKVEFGNEDGAVIPGVLASIEL